MLAPSPPSDRDRFTAITAAITCVAVVGIGLSLSIPLLSLEMERMGASGSMIGLNTAVGGFASILTVPFVPRLAARVGVLQLLLLSIVFGAALLVGFKVFYDFAWWFPLRFFFSATLGALFVLSEFWITQAAPPERRGLVMGIYATVLALGFAIGPGLLVLLGTEGFAPYLAGAALFVVAAVPIVLARSVSPTISREGGSVRFLAYLRLAPAATLAAFIYGAVETGGFAILPLYGLKVGFDAQTAAGLVSAVALGNVLFAIPVGWLADRIDRGLVLLAASLAGAVGAALIPAASVSLPVLVALLFLWGGVAGTLYTVGLAHLGASVRGPDLAGANAAFVALYSAGLMIGPPMIGAGMDLIVPQGFAWTLAAMFAAYAIIVTTTTLRRRAAADRAAPPERVERLLR
ncbi:MFS transporter [Methylobacterium haplocladii]|uniref:MFS transporter n=1 Tax=Methylobacterium haplocladii TaxID=1176176 RepID=A0A512ILM5_9HYPH|nr:MFS transporter [Methylobacterium haplocladii]GEO98607.1 MFS transporter [Methylobacterium haplocladii]GJD83992.1 putative MFS-type transporter YcaD [Methylobacterium haplocladii]GLS59498.1 MFS transporter [Methylobacterium haplocladii]